MSKKKEDEHRRQRRRREKKEKVNKIVWLHLDTVNIERTIFASAAQAHKKFMSILGRIQWQAFSFPTNGRIGEIEKAITESNYLIIYEEDSNCKFDRTEIVSMEKIVSRIKKYNKNLKTYINTANGKKISPEATEFTDYENLLTIIK